MSWSVGSGRIPLEIWRVWSQWSSHKNGPVDRELQYCTISIVNTVLYGMSNVIAI